MREVKRARQMVAVAVAVTALIASAGGARAGVASGSPEVATSPLTRTDPAGDCQSGAGPGGAGCDIIKLKVVNGSVNVKLIATYTGTPALQPVTAVNNQRSLVWYLEGAADYSIRVTNHGGVLDATVLDEPYIGGDGPCWSGNGDSPEPVIDGQRVIVVMPRTCLPGLTTLRAYAEHELVKPSSAAVYTDRAPNTGYTARISVAP